MKLEIYEMFILMSTRHQDSVPPNLTICNEKPEIKFFVVVFASTPELQTIKFEYDMSTSVSHKKCPFAVFSPHRRFEPLHHLTFNFNGGRRTHTLL